MNFAEMSLGQGFLFRRILRSILGDGHDARAARSWGSGVVVSVCVTILELGILRPTPRGPRLWRSTHLQYLAFVWPRVLCEYLKTGCCIQGPGPLASCIVNPIPYIYLLQSSRMLLLYKVNTN
jgi:hypothetical protein